MFNFLKCMFFGHDMEILGVFDFWNENSLRKKERVYYCSKCHEPFVPGEHKFQLMLSSDDVKCFLKLKDSKEGSYQSEFEINPFLTIR